MHPSLHTSICTSIHIQPRLVGGSEKILIWGPLSFKPVIIIKDLRKQVWRCKIVVAVFFKKLQDKSLLHFLYSLITIGVCDM